MSRNIRPIALVIKAIQSQIPNDFENKAEFDKHVKKIALDSAYTAPEDQRRHWGALVFALENFLGKPDTEWKQTVQKICNNELDYAEFLPALDRGDSESGAL